MLSKDTHTPRLKSKWLTFTKFMQDTRVKLSNSTRTPKTELDYYSFEATFSRMFESSNFTSGVLALMLVVTMGYCVVNQLPVPESLSYAVASVIGYFFGAKKEAQRKRDDIALNNAIRYCPTQPPEFE